MLLQIRDFIIREAKVSTQQLTRRFSIEMGALGPMLDLLERKGLIRRCLAVTSSCKSVCGGCQDKPLFYERA